MWHSPGVQDHDETLEHPEIPTVIAELSGACVAYVHRATGITLDETGDTLPILDHYLRGAVSASPEVRAVIATAAGAYFGEVLRQSFTGRWLPPTEESDDWRLAFEAAGLSCAPVHFAEEAMTLEERPAGGAGFNIDPKLREVVSEVLTAMGELPADEYFLLATRYDVIESLLDRLRARRAPKTNDTETADEVADEET